MGWASGFVRLSATVRRPKYSFMFKQFDESWMMKAFILPCQCLLLHMITRA